MRPEADPGAEPRVVGALRFVLDQAERIAAEAIEPLEELEVPTPAAAMLGELARQQAEQHPVEGRFMFGKNLDDPEWSLVRIHPGTSGLAPRAVLHRLLGSAS
jgi:hypothetical protein